MNIKYKGELVTLATTCIFPLYVKSESLLYKPIIVETTQPKARPEPICPPLESHYPTKL